MGFARLRALPSFKRLRLLTRRARALPTRSRASLACSALCPPSAWALPASRAGLCLSRSWASPAHTRDFLYAGFDILHVGFDIPYAGLARLATPRSLCSHVPSFCADLISNFQVQYRHAACPFNITSREQRAEQASNLLTVLHRDLQQLTTTYTEQASSLFY